MDWREVLLVIIFVISLIAFIVVCGWAGYCAIHNLYDVTHQAQNPPRAQIYGGEI